MLKGWIKLHRQVMDHPFYEEERVFSKYEAWEYLLLNANHADNKALIDGKMMIVERGSFITSIRKLQERWKWSNTKAIKFLDLLELEKMITKKSDTKKTLITVVMYDFYQGEGEEKRHENDTETIQKHTNKNVNNANNENNKKKKELKEYPADSVELTNHLIDLMQLNNPNVKIPTILDKWYDEMEKLERLDKYDYMQIRSVIDWCQQDSFWKSNILSAPKFREKMGTMLLQMQRPKGGQANNGRISSFTKLQQMAREEELREASGHN